ncbi:SPOR domain-containing protein [Actimicrobium antarcticum]|uniref:SPOR domain-containing protein n=1 Tax=Actimicrobium antarcticum TaxID=1051899 RepID=A0ABP7T1I8_9BURK
MGLSSLFRKKPQEPDSAEGAFYSRAEEDSKAVRTRGKRQPAASAAKPVDPVLPEKKRARRRLVGAVALVLAAVIGLPMVLDSEPKPLAEDISIQIPSKDLPPARPVTARAAPANVPQGAALDQAEEVIDPAVTQTSPAKPPASVVAAKPVEESKSKVQIANATPTKPIAKPESKPESKPEPKPESKTESRPESRPEPKPESKPEPKSVDADEKLADSARARAILDGDTAATKTDKKPTKVIVQIAALASKEKVAELQEKLKSAGIASYTQTVSTEGGARIRIRIGPFNSQEEADKARAKLVKIGLTGTVVPS